MPPPQRPADMAFLTLSLSFHLCFLLELFAIRHRGLFPSLLIIHPVKIKESQSPGRPFYSSLPSDTQTGAWGWRQAKWGRLLGCQPRVWVDIETIYSSNSHGKQTTLGVKGDEELVVVNLFTHSLKACLLRGEVVWTWRRQVTLTLEDRRWQEKKKGLGMGPEDTSIWVGAEVPARKTKIWELSQEHRCPGGQGQRPRKERAVCPVCLEIKHSGLRHARGGGWMIGVSLRP